LVDDNRQRKSLANKEFYVFSICIIHIIILNKDKNIISSIVPYHLRNLGKYLIALLLLCSISSSYAQTDSANSQSSKDQIKTKENDPIVYVTAIEYRGNKKTKKRIISREVDIEPNANYALSDLEKLIELDENKIFNTSLFNSVNGEIVYPEDDSNLVKVIFFVEERWYIWPSIIFKLADRNFSDWLFNQNAATDRFEYGFKFDQYNVRGLNEKLSLLAQFGFKKRFGFSYRAPYLNKEQKLGMGIAFYYSEYDQIDYLNQRDKRLFIDADSLYGPERKRDIISTEVATRIDFTYRESFYNTHTFAALYRRNWVVDTILNINPEYYDGDDNIQNSIDITYNFTRDFRDRNNYPLNGFYISTTLLKRGLGIFGDINQGSADARFATYKPLYKDRIYLASSITAYTSFPKDQAYTNRLGLGFANNLLKGYELYVIQGQHYLMQKNELKLRLFSVEGNLGKWMFLKQFRKIPLSAYFKLYFDQGYVQNNLNQNINSILTNRYIYSVGAGLDLVTYYDAVLRLEYSLNSLGEAGLFINVKSGI